MIAKGQKPIDNLGIDQNGKMIHLSDYAGKKIAIYFYPKDDTPGCTAQACNLRDNEQALLAAGISVIGISADSEKSHKKFEIKYDLNFPLIADEEKATITAFGAWGTKKFMGKVYDGILRSTFLINEEGKVHAVIDKPKTKAHAEEIIELFKN